MKRIILLIVILLSLVMSMRVNADIKGQETVFLELLNAERVSIGQQPLTLDPTLQLCAEDHVKNMQKYRYCAHQYYVASTDTWIEFYQEYFNMGWNGNWQTECALRGTTSGEKALFMFKTSPGHWSALSGPWYPLVGVAKAADYWCVALGYRQP